ncbi:MAG: hypothetical protein KF789_12480 [Bdellovibrionaceae bacterium]|nr:hypothetical protein [Pseudobdellovibrionaceae bacterium]
MGFDRSKRHQRNIIGDVALKFKMTSLLNYYLLGKVMAFGHLDAFDSMMS